MKVTIPETLDEITLEQYIKYNRVLNLTTTEEAKTIGIISVFCNLTTDEVISMDMKDIKEISNQIVSVLNSEATFKQRFDKYGFIPNLDKITAGEYIDLDKYIGDIENCTKAMVVMYREIDQSVLGNYTIKPYAGTDNSNEMLTAPLSAYLGAKVFFWNLSKDLLKATKECLVQPSQQTEQLEKTLAQNGVGINQFIQSLEATISILTEQLKPTFTLL